MDATSMADGRMSCLCVNHACVARRRMRKSRQMARHTAGVKRFIAIASQYALLVAVATERKAGHMSCPMENPEVRARRGLG
jgi:hypothetical protein